jgi:protein subunit release factor B
MQLLLSKAHDQCGGKICFSCVSSGARDIVFLYDSSTYSTVPPLLHRLLVTYVEVFAGAGGIDCADWAGMLLRMYSEWASRRGCSVNVVHATPCSVSPGYRHAVMKCEGHSVYGWLRGEAGVHRLVRVSPYDELRRRHTSFAKIVIYPDVGEFDIIGGGKSVNGVPVLGRDDVRIETFRSSGPGGIEHLLDVSM